MEVLRLGVHSELQLPAYTIATATRDLSHICNLHYSSWQCWILNRLIEARNRTHILMDTSQVHNPLSHNRRSQLLIFFISSFSSLPFLFVINSSPQKTVEESLLQFFFKAGYYEIDTKRDYFPFYINIMHNISCITG